MYHVSSFLAAGNATDIPLLLEQEGISRNNPDVLVREYRAFGMNDALDIQARAALRPVAGDRRVFVLSVPSMTVEAQNALLKTIEEPKANAVFYFVTPSPSMLLPTVRSRSEVKNIAGIKKNQSPVDVDLFLAAPTQKRLDMLKPLYEHDEDEGRNIGGGIAFLQALEARFAKAKRASEVTEGIRAVYRARKYMGDRGSLLKSLLEQVALLSPKV